LFEFFFSSRRRHTISKRDWSSDVCSSDLPNKKFFVLNSLLFDIIYLLHYYFFLLIKFKAAVPHLTAWVAFSTSSVDVFEILDDRSEERRVGTECSVCGWVYVGF